MFLFVLLCTWISPIYSHKLTPKHFNAQKYIKLLKYHIRCNIQRAKQISPEALFFFFFFVLSTVTWICMNIRNLLIWITSMIRWYLRREIYSTTSASLALRCWNNRLESFARESSRFLMQRYFRPIGHGILDESTVKLTVDTFSAYQDTRRIKNLLRVGESTHGVASYSEEKGRRKTWQLPWTGSGDRQSRRFLLPRGTLKDSANQKLGGGRKGGKREVRET